MGFDNKVFKKFTDIKPISKVRKIYEQDEVQAQDETEKNVDETPKANLPEVEQAGNSESSPSKLFSKLFESREMAHIYHLQSQNDGSFAAHMALDDYYKEIVEVIDELIEVYQGQYGIIEGYDTIDTQETKTKDKIEYFTDLANFIKTERKVISQEDSHLHNIIDEAVALLYKALYKLKNLK